MKFLLTYIFRTSYYGMVLGCVGGKTNTSESLVPIGSQKHFFYPTFIVFIDCLTSGKTLLLSAEKR